MSIQKMQGTSAYLEYIGPKGRKRKKNCIHYKGGKCRNTRNQTYLLNCIGRMYCIDYYDSNTNETNDLENKSISAINKGKRQKDNKEEYLGRENIINKTVQLVELNTNEIINIKIVEEKDKDVFMDKISIESPLGKALCKTSIGDEFEIVQGNNTVKYRFKSI